MHLELTDQQETRDPQGRELHPEVLVEQLLPHGRVNRATQVTLDLLLRQFLIRASQL